MDNANLTVCRYYLGLLAWELTILDFLAEVNGTPYFEFQIKGLEYVLVQLVCDLS